MCGCMISSQNTRKCEPGVQVPRRDTSKERVPNNEQLVHVFRTCTRVGHVRKTLRNRKLMGDIHRQLGVEASMRIGRRFVPCAGEQGESPWVRDILSEVAGETRGRRLRLAVGSSTVMSGSEKSQKPDTALCFFFTAERTTVTVRQPLDDPGETG